MATTQQAAPSDANLLQATEMVAKEKGMDALVEECRPLMEHESGIEGFRHVTAKFKHVDDFGPTCVRNFVADSDIVGERSLDEWQQDAFGQVDAWANALSTSCGAFHPVKSRAFDRHAFVGKVVPVTAPGSLSTSYITTNCAHIYRQRKDIRSDDQDFLYLVLQQRGRARMCQNSDDADLGTGDLILLDANPLQDIANTLRINGVVVNGRWIGPEVRQQLLASLATP